MPCKGHRQQLNLMPSSKHPISDLATIRSGYHFRGKVEPVEGGKYSVIQIKDFDAERRFHPELLDQVNLERDGQPHLISKGNILFLSRGNKRFAAAITRGLIHTVAASYFYVLRVINQRVLPEYLAWYINQAPFQEELANLATGTHMPFVSLEEFRKLGIPVPNIELQRKIVELDTLARREQSLMRKIAEKQTQIATQRAKLVEKTCLRAVGANGISKE